MTHKQYIIVNGRAYDAVTGMPRPDAKIEKIEIVKKPEEQSHITRGTDIQNLHTRRVQKSATLNRRHVKQPMAAPLARKNRPNYQSSASTSQHSEIKKFAPVEKTTQKPVRADRPATTHPVVHRAKKQTTSTAMQLRQARTIRPTEQTKQVTTKPVQQAAPRSAKELKQQAISEALAKQTPVAKKPKTARRRMNWVSALSVGFAVMLLGGYLTYLSMPNISIKIAAIQSGIDAKYPGYKPDGYALNGPISFKNGEVAIKYAYADGSSEYTLTQQKSSWNSAAVKEYFAEKSDSPTTMLVDGLTIYKSGNDAAWVNGGILYHISGNAQLSGEQIRKIATSL